MECCVDMLQEYLDNELAEQKTAEVREHLASCRSCRRDLSEMRLLWADLGHCGDIETPSAISLFRQQAIYQALKKPAEEDHRNSVQHTWEQSNDWDFWASQRIAWQPLARAVEMVPGMDMLGSSGRTLAAAIPKSALKTAGFLARSYAKKRGRAGL